MLYCIDIETDGLTNWKNIWCVVVKCIETGEYQQFLNVGKDKHERERLSSFVAAVVRDGHKLVGHNILGFDCDVLVSALELHPESIRAVCLDTLVISKLVDYSRDGHSIEDYGQEFKYEKIKFSDFTKFSPEMLEYCKRDVDICERIYLKYKKYISNPVHADSIKLEHQFQLVVNNLHSNGFAFNSDKANRLLEKVTSELGELDKEILDAFPPKLKLIREITPKLTKYGTLSRTDFRWLSDPSDLSEYNGGPFCRCSWNDFNPSSHKQIVQVLCDANWHPVDKTKTHIETERLYNKVKNRRDKGLDKQRKELYTRLQELRITGWKVNETNLSSLPDYDYVELWKKKCRIKIPQSEHYIKESIIKSTDIKNEKPRSNITIATKDITEINSLNVITELVSTILNDCLLNKNIVAKFVGKTNRLWSIIVTQTDMFVDCSAACAMVTWAGLKDTPIAQENILRNRAAKLLARRILLESRRRTLTEWLGLVAPDDRIRGKFYAIGAWTHRMAHQNPNTANIPNEFDTAGKKKLLGKELRSLWCAPKNRLLVGCDAEGIQLRIFAHLINDAEFTNALVSGRKEDKTDPHSLNQRILGGVCKSRAAAKRFIYALLLGAGLTKLAEILGCSETDARCALDNLLGRYEGWQRLKEEVFPKDAKRGWFVGLDGRKVRIPGDTEGTRRHLAMSGYLQCGEAVCMKLATLKFEPWLATVDAMLVNFVHDEWQVECPNNMTIALEIANRMAGSLKEVGEDLKLNCPLAGSFYNDDLKDYTIGTNWSVTH